MNQTMRTICFFTLLLASTASISWGHYQPAETKIVFLKGNDLITANGDGSKVTPLVKDGIPKEEPHWSPDGERIVYRVAGSRLKDPMTHGTLVTITSSGGLEGRIPVLATESDGTVVGGMRFIESSGW